MKAKEKIEAYFSKDGPFKKELTILRELARQTEADETLKWGAPVYTADGKNVFGIMRFKKHYGVWFFNGVFLKDPRGVLESAQQSTKALRHWKFYAEDELDTKAVLEYMNEAITNQKKGIEHLPERKKKVAIPPLLKDALDKDKALKRAFDEFSPYKQREFCEHIGSAKLEKTRLSRLEKSLPLIRKGVALHDKYR